MTGPSRALGANEQAMLCTRLVFHVVKLSEKSVKQRLIASVHREIFIFGYDYT